MPDYSDTKEQLIIHKLDKNLSDSNENQIVTKVQKHNAIQEGAKCFHTSTFICSFHFYNLRTKLY